MCAVQASERRFIVKLVNGFLCAINSFIHDMKPTKSCESRDDGDRLPCAIIRFILLKLAFIAMQIEFIGKRHFVACSKDRNSKF